MQVVIIKKMEKKSFDHELASVSDQIRLISELEHIRSHALRAAVSSDKDEDEMFFLTLANQCRRIRREFMAERFPGMDDKVWCLCKATACLRQISYELWDGKDKHLREIDQLVDNVWGWAVNKNLSGCSACQDDKDAGK